MAIDDSLQERVTALEARLTSLMGKLNEFTVKVDLHGEWEESTDAIDSLKQRVEELESQVSIL